MAYLCASTFYKIKKLMSYPRCLVAGLSGGTGKTLVSLGLVRAITLMGKKVKTFKKGPDYIDSAWLALAANTPKGNLDPFFSSKEQLLKLFMLSAKNYDISIIEGNRGLFDGLDLHGTCSSAELARTLSAPVVLVINCTKMTRTTAALVLGCLNFDPELQIGGVILNHTGSARQRQLIRSTIEYYTTAKVLGAIPRHGFAHIEERKMGLPNTGNGTEHLPALDKLANLVTENVDINAVVHLASSAPTLKVSEDKGQDSLNFVTPPAKNEKTSDKPTIGYVLDGAFWFYYRENLLALENAGVNLIPVSLIDQAPLPKLDGLYISGSIPEDFALELSSNYLKRQQVAELIQTGLPVYAECGGLAYLCKELLVGEKAYPMAGVFGHSIKCVKHPQGLGYVEAKAVMENPFHNKNEYFRGHEFHFSTLLAKNNIAPCLELSRGNGLGAAFHTASDGLNLKNCFATYMHIYAPAVPSWASNFAKLCHAHKLTKD